MTTLLSHRRRIAAAVTAVLAVTAGAAGSAGPAMALPATAPAADSASASTPESGDPFLLTPGAEVQQLGNTGYLAATEHTLESTYSYDMRWHRYSDGTSVTLAQAWSGEGGVLGTAAPSDIVPTHGIGTQRILLRDMSAPDGTAPVLIDLTAVPGAVTYTTTIGSTVVAERYESGTRTPLLVSRTDGTQSARTITGLPSGLTAFTVESADRDGAALFAYTSAAGSALAMVDTRTATVTETYALPAGSHSANMPFFSATHVSWWEQNSTTATLVVAARKAGERRRFDFPSQQDRWRMSAPLGDWILYANAGPAGTLPASPLTSLTARSLNGETQVRLLDYVTSVRHGPDGALYARGGSVEHREGLYRITLGSDGRPSARLTHSTGEPTILAVTGNAVGSSVVLNPNIDESPWTWTLSHPYFSYDVTITQKDTGRKKVYRDFSSGDRIVLGWNGFFDASEGGPAGPSAPGAYSWELNAVPSDGIGPDLHARGDFTLSYSDRPHDYSWDGQPDLFARDAAGGLWRAGSQLRHTSQGYEPYPHESPAYVGPGWNTYDRIESVGNIAGTVVADMIARDKTGVLWLHQGTGAETKPLAARTKIGPGWQVYHQLAGGSDLTGDGKADLVATDKAGDLYLYKGTGNATTPFAPRKKIGFGWGAYNQITATGNIAGGPAGDLLARDTAGVLWLYLGKGDGTFASRIKVGPGWNGYTDIVAIGDASKDGRPDLYAYGPNRASYFYPGTGSWRAPLAPRRSSDLLRNTTTSFNHVS